MKIHYFQRYHEKENVATANTMLLLSRLYSYSSGAFFNVFNLQDYSNTFTPEIIFKLQDKNDESIPDATITQDSFKIVVETKMSDCFKKNQLLKHLNSFGDEKCKILLTLAPAPMSKENKSSIDAELKKYNKKKSAPVVHINTTFEKLANAIDEQLTENDNEMKEILEDYRDYCFNDDLITASESWKYMRVQLASKSFDECIYENVYVNRADKGFRAFDYLGLYKYKSIRAIGKVVARITAVETENGIEYETELGELTPDRKATIERLYHHGNIKHRYFFVDKFYKTDFEKVSPRAPMGSRIFDLTQILETEDIPDTKTIAKLLENRVWV